MARLINIIKSKILYAQNGQLLLEILIATGILAIAAAFTAQLTVAGLRANKASSENNIAVSLARETMEAVTAISFAKWQNIYDLTKDSQHYFATTSDGTWITSAGEEIISLNNLDYSRYFIVSDVCRDAGQIVATATAPCNGLTNDPSTQKITVTISTPDATSTISQFLTRWHNRTCVLTSWTATTTGTSSCPSTFYEELTDLVATGTDATSLELNAVPISGSLTSHVFDTASSSDGPAYNSIMWQGSLAPGELGRVRFQIAAAIATSGPWNFIGGTTCSSGDWFDPGAPDTTTEIACYEAFNNLRYFKYKIQLCSDDCTTQGSSTPRVDEVIFNLSP